MNTNATRILDELTRRGVTSESQKPLDVYYRGKIVGQYMADFVADARLIIEIKALTSLQRQHKAQLMNYLKVSGIKVGLLLNFGTTRLGVRRIVAGYDDVVPV